MIRFHLGCLAVLCLWLPLNLSAQQSWSRFLVDEEHCGSCGFRDMEKVDGGFLILMVDNNYEVEGAINWLTSYILKYDLQGNFLWSRQYDFTRTDPYGFNHGTMGVELLRLPNSEFLLYGYLDLDERDVFLAKFDIHGELLAIQKYGDEYKRIEEIQYENGLYALAETPEENHEILHFDLDSFAVTKSLSLDFEWCNGLSIKHNSAYFGAKDSIGLALHRYDLEGNSLARSTHYGRPMAWSNNVHLMVYEFDTLFLMDQDLQKINHHLLKDYSPYGGSVLGNHFWDFIPLNGWGVVLGGYTGSAVSSLHGPFLMRLDHHGEEVFGYNYSVPDMPISSIMVVEEVHDGYVIVIENLYTYDESWLIRLDKNGLLSTQEPPANKPALRVFPNPSTDAIQVQFPYVGDWRLVLVHSLGQELQTQTLLNTAIYLLDTSTFAAGTYILLARDQKGGLFSQKIQINRD